MSAEHKNMGALIIGMAEGIGHVARLVAEMGAGIEVLGAIGVRGVDEVDVGGVTVLGDLGNLESLIDAYEPAMAFVSIPAAMSEITGAVVEQLRVYGVEARLVPTPGDQIHGRVGLGAGRIDLNALLSRTTSDLDEAAIRRTLHRKRVLITGAGGSIGSHIAKIVARFEPDELLLMERAENNLFEIDRTLGAQFPKLRRRALLHDVTDARRTGDLLLEHRPHVIFHAAAHKHVPMMEDHPRQAVLNNFFGTKSIADAAHGCGAERFVMISSDKAVNPTSVMGATKRTAELYVQHLAQRSETYCSMVRFGNVLGSACSVVPIWSQQLAGGGPLTVTDPRMTRFFMTIPEAASLVIQAASLEQAGGPIFVLDMGEPIRIMDMAERFIKLHGLEPGRDVQVTVTGARPGEKLYEELQYESEDMATTAHRMVQRLKTAAPSGEHVAWMVKCFGDLIQSDDAAPILEALREAVPQMAAPEGGVNGADGVESSDAERAA